jgi:two-component system, NarL family, nitrate/nitrite response regulator NarL
MNNSRGYVRILIAGHNGLFREGLKTLLDEQPGFKVIGESHLSKEIGKLARIDKPDILLIDIEDVDPSTFDDLREIREINEKLKIILVVADIKKEQMPTAISAGIRGIILKGSAANSLFDCIDAVMEGQCWIPEKLNSDALKTYRGDPPATQIQTPPSKFGLTKREMQILTLVVAGKTNREVAKRFSISEQTVKHHVTNIFDKVGVYNRLELALFAIHHSLMAGLNKK